MATKRHARLQKWLKQHNITYAALALQLGLSESGVRHLLFAETIPTQRHNELMALGFPVDMMPRPLDRKPGRKRLVPDFPGLRQEANTPSTP